jgi:peptidyl-prolyl cis-trans isomerase A (cyclophilin A)
MRVRVAIFAFFAALLVGFGVTPASAAPPLPVVAIETNVGTILLRIDTAHAPITAKNFLHLVDTGAYNGSSFYRTVSRRNEPGSAIEVIQGGLGDHAAPVTIPVEPTAKTGLHNTDGVISMARTSDPNSASSEFFICIGDNTFLDSQKYADHFGYAAFGRVISGYATVLRINHASANVEQLTPPIQIIRVHRVHLR